MHLSLIQLCLSNHRIRQNIFKRSTEIFIVRRVTTFYPKSLSINSRTRTLLKRTAYWASTDILIKTNKLKKPHSMQDGKMGSQELHKIQRKLRWTNPVQQSALASHCLGSSFRGKDLSSWWAVWTEICSVPLQERRPTTS